ncbi:MAG: iron-sulfur cluster assembly accessory protein [Chlamydiae bacterium]|nr:iron-sulfur cluster assembly accessory protein [Chlamydiota bacterium]
MDQEVKQKVEKIIRTMTIDEIFSGFPHKSQKLALEMMKRGLQCVGCGAATWETLEAGMYSHGFSDAEIDALVIDLNKILEQKSDPSTISLTERAAEKFKEILEEEGKTGHGLRFGDRPGGCSGYEYILDFSEKAAEDDEVFPSNGIEIHVKKHLLSRLVGCEIDYTEGLYESGFKISNPNAKGSCGCGSSQSY